MSFKRKIDHTGRITLPSELLEKFNLKSDDYVEVSSNKTNITIRRFQPEFACVVTGEITDKGIMIGNAFISYKGLEIIEEEKKKNR